MRYNYDSYKLYLLDSHSKGSLRVKVTMKFPVNFEILRSSVNQAIKRYPYLSVSLSVDSSGGLVLSRNDRPVVLVETSDEMPMLGSSETNGHLVFLDCRGRNIYFNISHSLSGTRCLQFVFTTIYEYVRECFGVEADAPEINKPESPLLPGECDVPTMELLKTTSPVKKAYRGRGGLVLFGDILSEYFNPLKRSQEYRTYQFEEEPVFSFAKENHTSFSGVFLMLFAKALDRVLPDRTTPLCGGIVHNPVAKWGIPNAHSDVWTPVYLDYDRAMIRGNEKTMGEYTLRQLRSQTDPYYTKTFFRKTLELMEKIDRVNGLVNKHICAVTGLKSILPSTALSYIVSSGKSIHLGGLREYVEAFYTIIEGRMTLSISSMEGKIFAAFMQNIREEKYVKALNEVFDQAGFVYKMSGPFKQHIASHKIFS